MADETRVGEFYRPNGLTDIIHDFEAFGPKQYAVTLQEKSSARHNDHYSNDTTGTAQERRWQIVHRVNGTNVDQNGATINCYNYEGGNSPCSVIGAFARVKTKNSDGVWSGIFGPAFPYKFAIASSGTQASIFYLHHSPDVPIASSTTTAFTKYTSTWRIFQKAVAIVTNGAGAKILSGQVLLNQKATTDGITSKDYTFVNNWANNESYGGDNSRVDNGYEWRVQFIDPTSTSGKWKNIFPAGSIGPTTSSGVELVSGSLYGLGAITLRFPEPVAGSNPVRYKISLVAIGESTDANPSGASYGNSGLNSDTWFNEITITDFAVYATTTVKTITLPLIETVVEKTTASTNYSESAMAPFNAFGDFEIKVISNLNKDNASINETTTITDESGTLVGSPIVSNLSNGYDTTDWEEEILRKSIVTCEILDQNNIVIESKQGFGPHTFILTPGNYKAGYRLTPAAITSTEEVAADEI